MRFDVFFKWTLTSVLCLNSFFKLMHSCICSRQQQQCSYWASWPHCHMTGCENKLRNRTCPVTILKTQISVSVVLRLFKPETKMKQTPNIKSSIYLLSDNNRRKRFPFFSVKVPLLPRTNSHQSGRFPPLDRKSWTSDAAVAVALLACMTGTAGSCSWEPMCSKYLLEC